MDVLLYTIGGSNHLITPFPLKDYRLAFSLCPLS